jgi:hypothetical protein
LTELRYGPQKESLRDETITWIIKYTNDVTTAVSIACIAPPINNRPIPSNIVNKSCLLQTEKLSMIPPDEDLLLTTIDVQKTIPTFSTIGSITKLQEFVLLPSVGRIGQLELLLLQKKSMETRNSYDLRNYEQLVRSDVFKEIYIPENVLTDLHYGDQLQDRCNLKEETITWIVKYTNDVTSAVSIACIAVNEMKYFKNRVSLFYKTNDKNNLENDKNLSQKKRRPMVSNLKSILQNTTYADFI